MSAAMVAKAEAAVGPAAERVPSSGVRLGQTRQTATPTMATTAIAATASQVQGRGVEVRGAV